MAKKAYFIKKMKLRKFIEKNKIVFFFPLFLVFLFAVFKIKDAYRYHLLIAEDGIVERLQFLFFLFAGIFSFLTALNFFKKKDFWQGAVFLALSLGFFFIAGEEISWGQRILEIETPEELAQKNIQGEITIHNLNFIQGKLPQIYILIGLWGTFGWIIAQKLEKRNPKMNKLFPAKNFSLYFLPLLLYYLWVRYLDEPVATFIRDLRLPSFDFLGKDTLLWLQFWLHEDLNFFDTFIGTRDQEPAELIFSLGVFLFALHNFLKEAKKKSFSISKTKNFPQK